MICAKWSLVVVSSGVILQDEEQKGLGQFVESKHLTGSRYICNSNGMSRPAEKRDNEGRLRQSRGLIEHFATGLGEVIIGGDFNISPDNGSIAMFARNGCRYLIKDYAIDPTRNHLAWDRHPETPMHYSDYVITLSNVVWSDLLCQKNEVSDHLLLVL